MTVEETTEPVKTATFVKDMGGTFQGHASLYRLDPPLTEIETDWSDDSTKVVAQHTYVVVSANVVMFSGPETYIFPADPEGNVTDWGELDGSYRGGLDHVAALTGAGYTVAS